MDDLEQLQEILREDPAPTPRHIRPELIMGILAGVLAVVFLVLLVICIPYFSARKAPATEPTRVFSVVPSGIRFTSRLRLSKGV